MGVRCVARLGFAVFLLFLFLAGIVCERQYVQAYYTGTSPFSCTDSHGVEYTAEDWDYAIEYLGSGGGTIRLVRDYVLEYPGDKHVLPKKVNFIIEKDVEFSVSSVRFIAEGNIVIYGIMALQEGAVLGGSGDVTVWGGDFQKAPYSVEKIGDVCLKGTDIEEGQTLSESDISGDSVQWNADIPGTWSFAEPQSVPEVGTGNYDVLFTPKDIRTYGTQRFEACGQVTVIGKPEAVTELLPGGQNPIGNSVPSGQQETDISGLQSGSVGTQGERVVVVTKMVSTPSNLAVTVSKSFKKKKPVFHRVKRTGRKVLLRWKKVNGADGYQIQCIAVKSGSKKVVKKGKKYLCRGCALTISKVSAKKNFYVRIRAYKKVKKQRTYTKWSSVRKAK